MVEPRTWYLYWDLGYPGGNLVTDQLSYTNLLLRRLK